MARTTKKPRVLRKKNIMRKKGATAQAKQIATLSKQVTNLTKDQYESFRTRWQRNTLPIGNTGVIFTPYVCPIPYSPCDVMGTSPVAAAERFADNRQIASQQFFTKTPVFGYSDAAKNTAKLIHTGGTLRWQMWTTEPQYTSVGLYLIKPVRKQADQLTVDRTLKGVAAAQAPGSLASLYNDVDYTIHTGTGTGSNTTYFGSEINRKYWNVLYHREVSLAEPNAGNIDTRVGGDNTNPRNNALVAHGTIKLPAGGEIKAVGQLSQQNNEPVNAMEHQYVDERDEDGVYLVAILNDATVDVETVNLGFIVNDYYKAVV